LDLVGSGGAEVGGEKNRLVQREGGVLEGDLENLVVAEMGEGDCGILVSRGAEVEQKILGEIFFGKSLLGEEEISGLAVAGSLEAWSVAVGADFSGAGILADRGGEESGFFLGVGDDDGGECAGAAVAAGGDGVESRKLEFVGPAAAGREEIPVEESENFGVGRVGVETDRGCQPAVDDGAGDREVGFLGIG